MNRKLTVLLALSAAAAISHEPPHHQFTDPPYKAPRLKSATGKSRLAQMKRAKVRLK